MRPFLPLALCSLVAISGCSRLAESRINPLNWFDRGTVSAPVDASGNLRPLVTPGSENRVVDQRVPIDLVTGIEISRAAEGAIVTATGTAPTGAFNAQLVPVSQEAGTLTLSFRIEQGPNNGGTQTITAARTLATTELVGIRRIVVQGARNSATTSR